MHRLTALWIGLRSSLWLVPALVVGTSMGMAVLLIELHGVVGIDVAVRWPRVFGAGTDGSRAMLSAIATSMMTVAGVVFSVTIVALSQASTQYSPRVLRNFMRDRPTQVVLGVFVGIFAYCMVVLRTIRSGPDGEFIPALAVLGAMLYAFGGIGFLIYFIHHTAQSIQASFIAARIAGDTAACIRNLYPEEIGAGVQDVAPPRFGVPAQWHPVSSRSEGYVVAIAAQEVLDFAIASGRIVRLPRPGSFVVEGATLVEVGGLGPPQDDEADRLRSWITLAPQRTVEQDAAYGLQQLVDVALKALSPGINDPTTACLCIDRLSALLCLLARRRLPDPHRVAQERLRVIAPVPDFASYVTQSFRPIVRHSRGDVQVLARVLQALRALRGFTDDPRRLEVLRALAKDVEREAVSVTPRVRAAAVRREARMIRRG